MKERKKPWGVLTVLLLLVASRAQAQAQEPWGYLWVARTMQFYPLTKDVIQVGRLNTSDVVVTHPMVSRQHLEIRRTGDEAIVVDLRSTNGTQVNRHEIRAGQELPLQGGDWIAVAGEELIFQWTQEALFEDALRYYVLARLVVLRVPVLQDRTLRALGQERELLGTSEAEVDIEKEVVRMTYGNETQAQGFESGEKVFVGDAVVVDGVLRLSLWGVSRDAPLQSRRASYSNLVHGELRLRLAGASPEEARAHFERRWNDIGMQFLLPLIYSVLEIYSESQSADAAPQIAQGLAGLSTPTALSDGARSLSFLYRLDPSDSDLATEAARAEARWVKAVAETNKTGLDETQRSELVAALERGKGLIRTAGELGADETEQVEAEIVEAEGMLVEIP